MHKGAVLDTSQAMGWREVEWPEVLILVPAYWWGRAMTYELGARAMGHLVRAESARKA